MKQNRKMKVVIYCLCKPENPNTSNLISQSHYNRDSEQFGTSRKTKQEIQQSWRKSGHQTDAFAFLVDHVCSAKNVVSVFTWLNLRASVFGKLESSMI